MADDTTVKMIKAILDVKTNEAEQHSFEDELAHRFDDMENGKNSVKLTLNQLEKGARKAYQKKVHIGK